MKKLLCKIFGHKWLYGEWKGIQGQPTKRACKRCSKVQNFYGSMTSFPGTYGQFWYGSEHWFSSDEYQTWQKKEKAKDKTFKELTSK